MTQFANLFGLDTGVTRKETNAMSYLESLNNTATATAVGPVFGTSTSWAQLPGVALGSTILTKKGVQTVESLSVGDRVITRDHGFQTLLWIGRSRLEGAASGHSAIHFTAGALGGHEAITLSPKTRVLLRSDLARALFGESEVFAYAADLVNDSTIRPVAADQQIEVIHLLFDQHEILRTAEMEVESLHPDRALMRALDDETRATLLSLLPNHDDFMGYGRGPAARSCLRMTEARILADAVV